MATYDVLIKFVNGTSKTISGVNNYSAHKENGLFYVEKNGYIIFIPIERVLYIGRAFDIGEAKNSDVIPKTLTAASSGYEPY